jgi:hypothetical protein
VSELQKQNQDLATVAAESDEAYFKARHEWQVKTKSFKSLYFRCAWERTRDLFSFIFLSLPLCHRGSPEGSFLKEG